ncbi:MAG: hypothetical protein P4L90_18635 [Rhodopila sp.]|nr:hypothetical protein [Rhodopila sp.]
MIRPLTIVTFLMACGSGLYLYQSKHEVQLLDRTIERTVRDTGALREQSRLLAAEWTMLNDPDRLRQFSDTYLSLKTIAPSQFTSIADLDNRLPAPRAELPTHEQDPVTVPQATETEPQPVAEPAPAAVADEVLPVPPIPNVPRAPVIASVIRPVEPKVPDRVAAARPVVDSQTRPVTIADGRSVEQRPSEQRAAPHVVEAHMEARPPAATPPRPIVLAARRPLPAVTPAANGPVSTPLAPVQARPAMVAAASPYGGSMLGMARGSTPPPPRPTPINATYNAN